MATAWFTIRREAGAVGVPEKAGLAIALVPCSPFMLLSSQLALGPPTVFHGGMAFRGPILAAIYLFTFVLAIAAGSDAVVVFSGGASGASRIAWHLWPLCVALTLATGSALSNGLPRLLPAGLRLPDWTLYLQFVWVALLFYWMLRVRLTRWSRPWTGETPPMGRSPASRARSAGRPFTVDLPPALQRSVTNPSANVIHPVLARTSGGRPITTHLFRGIRF